jgi:hypothetical protein
MRRWFSTRGIGSIRVGARHAVPLIRRTLKGNVLNFGRTMPEEVEGFYCMEFLHSRFLFSTPHTPHRGAAGGFHPPAPPKVASLGLTQPFKGNLSRASLRSTLHL